MVGGETQQRLEVVGHERGLPVGNIVRTKIARGRPAIASGEVLEEFDPRSLRSTQCSDPQTGAENQVTRRGTTVIPQLETLSITREPCGRG
jgi:hypothetical protein